MENNIAIRAASPDDAAELLAIYAPYVRNTAITFEYDVPSADEFRKRIESTLEKYPYIVAVRDGKILGYAYLSAFHPRAAYGWCAETSIYVAEDLRAEGLGSLLYGRLEEIAKKMGILNLEACICWPNDASVAFHEKWGYVKNGHFVKCGWKLGRWWDMIWMEKLIGSHEGVPKPVAAAGEVE
jgi:L-amino acid N-acyltransferase YncA